MSSPQAATHLCANTDCSTREWHISSDSQTPKMWRISGYRREYTIAYHRAVCPVCGETLLEIAGLEPNLELEVRMA